MRRRWFLGAVGIVSAAALLCTVAVAAPINGEPEILTPQPLEEAGDWDYRQDGAGQVWLAYYDQHRLLRLREPGGQERLLVPEGRGQSPSGLAMSALASGVDVLWRDKHPVKGLYLLDASQPDSQPLEVGGDTQPLARFEAAEGHNDLLHLLWYGEKAGEPTGEQYNLYYRSLNLKDQSRSPIELVMPGIYPLMSVDESGGVMVYSWLQHGKTPKIVARYRSATSGEGELKTDAFGPQVKIAEVPAITPVFDAFRSGSRWFVVWLAQYGADRRDFLLEGAHSDDQGKTWQRFSIEDLRGTDLGSLEVAADKDGHILMAVSGRPRTDDAKIKEDVYVIRSADRGETWAVERMRAAGETGDQPESLAQFHARNPSVAFGPEPGQVLVVWQDWRDIRSGLYASLSNDYGKTWALSNVPLTRDSGKNIGLRYEPNALYLSGDRFNVIAEQSDDGFAAKQLIRLGFTAKDLAEHAASQPTPDIEAQRALLRKRANGFWQTMIAADYPKAYAYQDPFFRARVTLNNYLSKMGKIKYTQADVEEIQIDGPKAKVTTRIKASVPPFRAPKTGEMISQPEREISVTNSWLWVDGDWYREFGYEAQGISFSRY